MRAIVITVLMCGLLASHSASAAGANDKGNTDKTAAPATAPAAAPGPDTKAPANPTQPAASTKDSTPAASPALEAELDQLRQLMESQQAALKAQQDEIEALKTQLGARGSNMVSTIAPSGTVAASPGSTPAAAAAVAGTQYGNSDEGKDQNSPLSFKIGAANFTPGGFVDFTSYTRTTNVGSGIGTSFGSIPFNNNSSGQGGQTESRFSAQNSRITLKAEAPVGGGDITGYVETDFLGNAPTNLNVTSNSNTLRMRVYFADYTRGKWEMLAGQDWSMLTPNRKGIGVMPSDVFYTQDMDTNYQVGLVWSRQAQFRLLYHPTDRWTLGVSFENPDQYTGSAVTFPSCFGGTTKPCTSQTNQVDQGTTTTSPAVFPDIIAKIARDQHIGEKNWHFELAGITSQYRLFTPSSASNGGPGSSQSATGGGITFNMNLEIFKNFHLIANTFWSDGEGRYIYGLGPNFIVNQNPTSLNYYPSLVHAGSGIGGFEWQFTKKSMLYGYYGGAYFGRTVGFDPLADNAAIGYGFTGSSSSDNRAIQEGTLGVIQTFWKNPNYGALQMITQASYVTRSPWYVDAAAGDPANAHTTMFYVDLRYVLP